MNLDEIVKLRESLNQIIAEGDLIEEFMGTEAWSIIKRTLIAQRDNYKADCFDAAKDSTKNLANFLGRMEAIEWIISTIENSFSESRTGALARRKDLEEELREQELITRGVNEQITQPTYHANPGMI